MKPSLHNTPSLISMGRELRKAALPVTALAFAALFPNAHAASDTWTGATDATWATSGNWLGGNVPGAGDTATFNAASANTTTDLGAGVTLGGLVFDTGAAAYTIGSGAVGSQTLTLGTVGNAITMNSGVTADQLINSNLALAVSTTAGNTSTYYTVTNDSLTNALTLAGGVSASTAGTKVLGVTGSGNTTISGAISAGSGAVNLVKTGTGTLTLSGGAALGGNFVTSFGGTVGTVLLGGTTKVSSGAYTSTGEFVVGGILANGGAGVNTNLTMDAGSLTISNYLSLGRGNGVGAVSSDIVLNNASTLTANNFSAGFNNGNTSNLPKGTFTLNGTSGFTVAGNGTYNLAESAGSNMTMTLNDSSTLTVSGSGNKFIGNGGTGTLTLNGTSSANLGSSVIAVGQQNGTGVLNVNGTSTFTSNTEIRVAYSAANGGFTGSGTINVGGGTLNTNALTVGRNNNDVTSTMSGTVNVTSGALNVKSALSLIGWRGIGVTGTVNISGGSYNQGTTATANMVIGSFTGVTGAVNVSGTGALTFQNNSNLRFSDSANASPTGTLTINGGSVTFYSDAGSTVGGTGVIDLMNNATATGTNTINLNGGTLTANQIKATGATGTRVINFNGGTLKTASSGLASTFLASGVATTANVRNGGVIIDTNGIDTTIGQALVHSTIGGDNAIDGGLTKNGLGTLTLGGTNTFTGNAVVNTGTLSLATNVSLNDAIVLSLAGGTTLNMAFASSSETIFALVLNGTNVTPGTYTDAQLNALSTGVSFTSLDGTATLTVLSAVPEPGTVALLVMGLGGAMIFVRRRKLA